MFELINSVNFGELLTQASQLDRLTGGALSNTIRTCGGDAVRKWTTRKQNRINQDTREKVKLLGGVKEDGPDLALVEPAIRAATYEGREELHGIWSTLIAKILTGHDRGIRISFIETLKKFDPADALLLQIYNSAKFQTESKMNVQKESTNYEANIRANKIISECFSEKDFIEDDVQISKDRLHELGCLSKNNSGQYFITAFGRRLYTSITMPGTEET